MPSRYDDIRWWYEMMVLDSVPRHDTRLDVRRTRYKVCRVDDDMRWCRVDDDMRWCRVDDDMRWCRVDDDMRWCRVDMRSGRWFMYTSVDVSDTNRYLARWVQSMPSGIDSVNTRVCVYCRGCPPSGLRFPAPVCGLFTCVHICIYMYTRNGVQTLHFAAPICMYK